MKKTLTTLIALFLGLAVVAQNGFGPGFLAKDALDYMIPAIVTPPAAPSLEDSLYYVEGLHIRQTNPQRVARAAQDAVWSMSILTSFSEAVGIPLTAWNTPELWQLVAWATQDTDHLIVAIKERNFRQRPYVRWQEPDDGVDGRKKLSATSSTPSGHSALAATIVHLLVELYPQRAAEIIQRGDEFIDARWILGFHFKSDCELGRRVAGYAVDVLHSDPDFLLQLQRAREEAMNQQSICYEQFGAKGDGVTDDLPAIVAAHEAANAKGIPVKALPGKTYYIGGRDLTAVIQTSTDWGDARFIIDDRQLENIKQHIFVVKSSAAPFSIIDVKTLHKGQKKLGRKLPQDCLIEVEDSSHKVYIREGLNQDSGKDKSELFVALKDGTVREDSGIVWEFGNITKMTAYPMDRDTITIRGGFFTTIANQAESKYNYHNRGIEIRRANVVVEGISHFVTGEMDHGAPYAFFVGTRYAADVIIRDCLFTARKTYSTIGSAGKPVRMGSYDLQANKSVNVRFKNITQTTDIEDGAYWGLFASNFCKSLSMENCVISRFDAHLGVRDVTLKGCTFGYMGVRVVGFGTMLIEDCEVRTKEFFHLRNDYGSSWEGNIIIRNCRFIVKDETSKAPVITGTNSGLHDFGYRCQLPSKIVIENLYIDDTAVTSPTYQGPVLFDDFQRSPSPVYPYPAKGTISLQGITVQSGKPFRLADDSAPFGQYRLFSR